VIRNRDRLSGSAAHDVALDCVAGGIEAARPERVVHDRVRVDGDTLYVGDAAYDLAAHDEVLVLGGGKAASQVAAALEKILGDRLAGGVVVTDTPVETDRVEVHTGEHPVPAAANVTATRELLARADAADDRTLVLAAITGGGSALLAAPAVELDDLVATTEALLESGATIHEVNAVRKHLSRVKGGRLARRGAPATVVTLLFSDVVGNDPDVIASGPTVPDPSTFGDALDVLDRHDVGVPGAVREHLEAGASGDIEETPKPGDPGVAAADTHILADGSTAVSAARAVAVDRGYRTVVLSSRMRGEAREAALAHVAVAEECSATGNPVEPPAVVLSGGETTVTVRGEGTGGPNLEFALRAAVELDGGDTVLAAVDTDGRDGSTGAAGALVDADTVDDPAMALDALADNDAYPYLAEREALIETGATGTNVNDLRVLVVHPRRGRCFSAERP